MAELWLQPVDEAALRWAEARSAVLSEDEMQRWRRYMTSDSQALFLVAHVATRHVLSRYDDREPGTWRFDRGTYGRPEIVSGPPHMRFNISHTEGMVAILVHGRDDAGVDVEHSGRSLDMRSVARRVFTDAEQAALFRRPATEQADWFYQLWTLKEAFIKAKGKGLALPLQQFSFAVHEAPCGAEPVIEFNCDPAIESTPDQWAFSTSRLETGHVVSCAVHHQDVVPASVGVFPQARWLDCSTA